MSNQEAFEVECRFCGGIFDLDHNPGETWVCECQKMVSPLRRYWISCSKNRRHRYFAVRSEECKYCVSEEQDKKSLFTLQHGPVIANGKPITVTDDRAMNIISPYEVQENIINNLKAKEYQSRELQLQILTELKKISAKLDGESIPKELDDK